MGFQSHYPLILPALDKMPDHTGKMYRNITFDGFGDQEAFDEFMAGVEAGFMVFDGYTSTSTEVDGYPKYGGYVVHMMIDGKTGRDIADTYGVPRQQEVILLPGTTIEITKVATANDGNPLIYAKEVAASGLERNHEDEQSVRSAEADGKESRRGESSDRGAGETTGAVRENARDHGGADGVLPERRESAGALTEAEEVGQKTELATQENARGNNFSISEDGLKLPKGDKARFKANVEAIKTLRKLMAENRRATPEEQEILSKYVGWGGLANAFDEKKADWAKEYKQLKNLLNEKEYSSARGSTLNAHYTDVGVIRAIYTGLSGLGFKGGRLLEPFHPQVGGRFPSVWGLFSCLQTGKPFYPVLY